MPDVMSTAQRSKVMSRIQGKNTSPERKLRRALWALGLRYRLQYKIGRFKPDLVFTRVHIAVFIDSCFWHRCPLHGVMPKGNQAFWKAKLEGNARRDVTTTEALISEGWMVMRFWEHEIDESAEACARRVASQRLLRSIARFLRMHTNEQLFRGTAWNSQF